MLPTRMPQETNSATMSPSPLLSFVSGTPATASSRLQRRDDDGTAQTRRAAPRRQQPQRWRQRACSGQRRSDASALGARPARQPGRARLAQSPPTLVSSCLSLSSFTGAGHESPPTWARLTSPSSPRRAHRRSHSPRMRVGKPGGPLPSYLYLLISSVLAIAAIGCVFELSSGKPQYGVPFTTAILAASFPAFAGTFWIAIKQGQAESDDDDDM